VDATSGDVWQPQSAAVSNMQSAGRRLKGIDSLLLLFSERGHPKAEIYAAGCRERYGVTTVWWQRLAVFVRPRARQWHPPYWTTQSSSCFTALHVQRYPL